MLKRLTASEIGLMLVKGHAMKMKFEDGKVLVIVSSIDRKKLVVILRSADEKTELDYAGIDAGDLFEWMRVRQDV